MTRVIVERLRMGDVEDPYLMAGFPIAEWEKGEKAQWVMANALEPPVFHCWPDADTLGYRVEISAKLTTESEAYMYLKWGKP